MPEVKVTLSADVLLKQLRDEMDETVRKLKRDIQLLENAIVALAGSR